MKLLFNLRVFFIWIVDCVRDWFFRSVYADRISTTDLVNMLFNFCEVYSGKVMYKYQEQMSKRIIRSVLENDGEEITGLFSRQSGKCFAKDTEILMADGRVKKVQDIKVGDYVMRPDSTPARVTNLGRGREEMFEVRSREKNHESFTVNRSHILSLVGRKGEIENISVEDFLKLPEWKRKDYYRGYRVPVDFEEKKIDIDPYFLGLWIGDGNSHDLCICNVEEEVEEYLSDYAKSLGMNLVKYESKDRTPSLTITNANHSGKKNPLRDYLRKENLFKNKHIPDEIMLNSRKIRLEFLAGLIDSDGYKSKEKGKENSLEITSHLKPLAEQYVRLMRSLGFRVSMKEHTTSCNGKSFVSYRVYAYGDFSVVPTKVERRKYENVTLRENPLTFGFDLISKGEGDYYGFTIDTEDHLFLLGDYTVTHNTETIAITVGGLMIILPRLANMPMFMNDPRFELFKDGFWVGIFAPSMRQSQITYNRMRSRMSCKEAQAVLNDPDFMLEFSTSNGTTVSLTNGSYCMAISASDNSNIEGETFKLLIMEECQDISNYKIRKCLTGDTRVLLSSGEYKSLKDIVENEDDEVVCFDSDMNNQVFKYPIEYYDNGVQDVYRVTLDNGSSIKATLNHQFYTLNKKTNGEKCKFRTLSDIVNSMDNDRPLRIAVPDKLPYFADDNKLDYERGLIIGYFMGDGCATGTPKFIGDIPTCTRLHELINEVCGDVKMTVYHYNKDNGMQEVCFSTPTNCKGSNPLTMLLKEYELYGCTGVNKKLPNRLFSKEFYRGYIEALIETDGCVESCTTKPIISFANISKDMVEQLRDIYLKFGIHSTLFKKDNKGGISDNSKDLYLVHVKSILDVRRFYGDITLFRKQCYLNEAFNTIKNKESREVSKYYNSNMRFCKVKSVEYVGKEHTYCLKVEGRNFIANNMVSSNSIHPMGAAYNSTIIKIGTPTTFKGDFYETIQRNKEKHEKGGRKNHFEYNYLTVMKYNPRYAKYVEREKERLGETSDEFRMSYGLEWIISRGMFVDIEELEKLCGEDYLDVVESDTKANHVAGLDIGGGSNGKNKKSADSTVCTIVEVDWDNPVLMDKSHDEETNQDIVYMAFNTYIKAWLELSPEIAENYEEQYSILIDYFKRWKISKLVCDATREASLSQRIAANVRFEVVPFVFSVKSKSELYKHLQTEIKTGRARYPNSEQAKRTPEHKKFLEQMGDLQKGYRGADMVVSHPDERGAHDDFADSWGLAVWGARDPGQIDETETNDRRNVLRDKSYVSSTYGSRMQTSKMQRRNRYTGRRR